MTATLRRHLWPVAFLAAWIVEAVLTHTPAERLPDVPANDKVEHFLAYAVLGTLGILALRSRGLRFGRRVGVVVVGMICWAVLDEVTQPIFRRDCSGWDMLADTCGVAAALLADAGREVVHRRRTKRTPTP